MRTRSQRLHDDLDEVCADIVKERDGHKCRRCGGAPVYWAHIIRRSRSKAVRWNPDNALALCRSCHKWFDVSADKIQAAIFIEQMIGKEKMAELHELASSRNARPWLVYDLEKKLQELKELRNEQLR